MRVEVTEAFTAYLNMQPERFAVGDQIKGSVAVYLMDTAAPVKPIDDDAVAYAAGEPDAEPPAELDIAGTANEILAWVNDDPERARQALEAEQAKGDAARSTLVKSLEKIAD